MKELTLYGFAGSTYTKTALMVAAEVGATVELKPLEFKKPSHLAMHPYGKMPVMIHDGLTLFETLAIAWYIDQNFGNGALCPRESVAHAKMLQWISAAIDYAYPDLVKALLVDAPPSTAYAQAGEQLKLLDTALKHSAYFAGDRLTLADLFLYPMVEFALSKLSEKPAPGLASLERWRSAVATRPSIKKVA